MTRQRSSIDILEGAVTLLRSSPLESVLTYLIGAAPLTLAFLFFLADMNRSPYAFEHLPWASLSLAILYIWKNSWQAIFMAKLYNQLSPSEVSPTQAILTQATLQPVGLLIPIPLPWITAFFRNVALYSALGRPDAISAARRQSVHATRQNWGVLVIVALGSILLFANVLVTIVILPQLTRSFLGIEGDLARLGSGHRESNNIRSSRGDHLAVCRSSARRGLYAALLLWRISFHRQRSASFIETAGRDCFDGQCGASSNN